MDGGVDVLMDKDTAGTLKKLASTWGYSIEKVEVEQFDVPKEVKEANLKKAAAAALMAAKKIENDAAIAMINDLKASGISANAALNTVNMRQGLPVESKVTEITITDLERAASIVAEKFGGHLTAAVESFTNRSKL